MTPQITITVLLLNTYCNVKIEQFINVATDECLKKLKPSYIARKNIGCQSYFEKKQISVPKKV